MATLKLCLCLPTQLAKTSFLPNHPSPPPVPCYRFQPNGGHHLSQLVSTLISHSIIFLFFHDFSFCRWEHAQRLQASAAIESAAAAQVPAYKAQAWLTRANHLQKHNNTLAQQMDVVSQHLLAAQQAQAHAELSLQHAVQAQV